MSFSIVSLSKIAKPVVRPIAVVPGAPYRTIGVKWWGEGAYERETIDGAQTAAKTLSIVRENDLIINKIWVRHGSIAIASNAVDGCAASGEFPTFELDNLRILPCWIHWLTKSKYFWEKCDNLSHGTSGKNRIKPELFLTIEIPLPPLEEQQRIVARIEELVAKIEQARGLYREISSDIYRMLLSKYDEITHDVERFPMRDVAPLERKPVLIELEKEYHELGIRSFGKGTFHKFPITGAALGTKRIFKIEENDLLFSIVFAWEGAVAVARPIDHGRVGSHRFLTCVPKKDLATSSFLCFHFLTEEGLQQILDASPGSAGRNRTLGIEALGKIHVPVPPLERQLEFDALQKNFGLVERHHTEISAELDALLPSILDKAFKGEL